MNIKLKKIAAQLAEFWKSLNKKKKIIIICVFSGTVIALSLIIALANHVTYTLLYTGLNESEAAEIYDKVEEMGYAVETKGTGTLYVDSRYVDKIKMQLAESGYPESTLSYDIFEKSDDWATTDSARETYKLYQLQDRLQSTIETINGVENAIVTIAQADTNDYVLSTDETEVTASVKLTLATGASLTTQQVKGIVVLVAKSVPDLSEDNVTVLDSDGVELSADDNGEATATTRLELQQKVESTIKSKILSVLEPIFGSGQVKVAATATMDFSTTTVSKTTYGADSATGTGIPQTEKGTAEGGSTTGTAAGVAGISGGSGVTTYTTSGASSSNSPGGTVTSWDTTYLVDTINEMIQDDGGKVTNISVAVVLNSVSSAASMNVANLKETVAYALGIDPANVSIQLAAFAGTGSSVTVNTTTQAISNQVLIGAGIGLAAFLIFVALLSTMLISKRKKAAAAKLLEEAQAEQAEALENQPVAGKPAVEQKSIEEILSNSQSTTQKLVEEFADKKPELVAQILRNWLKDS